MEIILAIVIFLLAALGLGAGLLLTGKPPRTACGGLACSKNLRCAGCPRAGEPDGGSEDG